MTSPQRFLVFLFSTGVFVLFLLRTWPYHKSFTESDANIIAIPLDEILSGDPIELPQNDPRIKKFIWERGYLVEPSSEPYNLIRPDTDPSIGQGQTIRKLFTNKKNGFFVESGALDGETRSNTLYLEKELGWKGLLVEPDPSNYAMMLEKKRKAFLSNTCLSTKPYPQRVLFQPNFNVGRIMNDSKKTLLLHKNNSSGQIIVQCFPLYSLLNALGVSTIDYFSLDIEGEEMEVLETFPFDKLFVKTLSVEFSHIPKGKENLQRLMESKGYILVAQVTHKIDLANDFIFVHKSLQGLIDAAKKLVGAETDAPFGSTIKLMATAMKYKKRRWENHFN